MKCKDIKKFLDKESGFDISTKGRKHSKIVYRAIYYYLCQKYASDGVTLESIGVHVNKDHASVLNGFKTLESFVISNDNVKSLLETIEKKIVIKCPKSVDEINKVKSFTTQMLQARYILAKRALRIKTRKIYYLKQRISLLENQTALAT